MHVKDKGMLKSVVLMSGEILSAEIWLFLHDSKDLYKFIC